MSAMHFPLVLSHPAQYQYRNEVPQHHHRDLPSSRAMWHSSVLSHQHGWGCGKFGTKRPQVQILSPRPFPQIADLRECCFLRSVFHLPAIATEASREQEGTRGNKKESRGRLRQTEEHRPPSTTQQTQRHRRVLQGTVILRPQRRGLSGGTSAGQEPVPIRSRHARQAQDRQRAPPRKRIQSTLAPSTRLNECVEMTRGQTCGRP
jgi:hypothetical protein